MPRKEVSFKNTDEEKELLEWVEEKSKILGFSSYVKQLLYEKMLQEKATKK